MYEYSNEQELSGYHIKSLSSKIIIFLSLNFSLDFSCGRRTIIVIFVTFDCKSNYYLRSLDWNSIHSYVESRIYFLMKWHLECELCAAM